MKSLIYILFVVASTTLLNADQKITITGNDSMQFDTKEFTVKAGKKVELTFKMSENFPSLRWDTTS